MMSGFFFPLPPLAELCANHGDQHPLGNPEAGRAGTFSVIVKPLPFATFGMDAVSALRNLQYFVTTGGPD